MQSLKFFFVLVAVFHASASVRAQAQEFYGLCLDIGVPNVATRPLAQRVAILRDLGYDGIALPVAEVTEPNLRVVDAAGLKLYMTWETVNVNPAKQPGVTDQLVRVIKLLRGRPTTLCVLLVGLAPGDPRGTKPAVAALRQLGDLAAEQGLRVSIYHHLGDWTERLPFAIDLVKQVQHPQVGFNFNLCHWLKLEGARDYRQVLSQAPDKIFCVTINGATVGSTGWADGLIRPLDEGDFDNCQLQSVLRRLNYRGPVGLMCYGIKADLRSHLERSMAAWRQISQAPAQ